MADAEKRIAVTGGRDRGISVPESNRVFAILDAVRRKHPDMVLVHGACGGIDLCADAWAQNRDVRTLEYPADWKRHEKAAGPIRNRAMARSGLHGCVAFPGGDGTANMVAECEAAGVPVWRVEL